MVNGLTMLSSASSCSFLATLSAKPTGGEAAGPAVGGGSAFAELLGALPGPSTEGVDAAAAAPASPMQELPITQPKPVLHPSHGAALGKPATASGKNLPVALPVTEGEFGEANIQTPKDAVAGEPVEAVDAATTPAADPLVVLPLTVDAPQPAAIARSQPLPVSAEAAPRSAARAPVPAAAKPLPVAQAPEASPAPAPIAISARVVPAATSSVAAPAAAQPDTATDAKPKAARPLEVARLEAPAPLPQAAATPAAAQTEPAASGPVTPTVAPNAPAQPTPADITAALDHLAAAREALMPAEAALAIDHAEFGEVSIRFEQSREGRLSVELAAADPELQRAVTAAVAADRAPAGGGESDGGRATHSGHQRGSAAGNDAAPGDRSAARHDRDEPQRRGQSRPQAGSRPAQSHAGVFA